MAFYVWAPIGADGTHSDPSWPAPFEWSDNRTPDGESGWKTFIGSEVCFATPWSELPAELWFVEVDGEHVNTPTEILWERIKLVECVGTLTEDKVAEIAYRWAQQQYLDEMIHSPFPDVSRFRIEWVGNSFKNLRAFMDAQPYDQALLDKHSFTPLTWATRVVLMAQNGEYRKAWATACMIPNYCNIKDTRLAMAGRLREVMNGN